MTKEELFDIISEAEEKGHQYMVAAIEIEAQQSLEFILNTRDSFVDKLSYMDKVYNDFMKHKHSPGIRVLGIGTFERMKESSTYMLEMMYEYKLTPNA